MASNLRFSSLKLMRIGSILNINRFYSNLIGRKCLIIDQRLFNFRTIQFRNFEQEVLFENEEEEIEEKAAENLEAHKSVITKRLFAAFIREFVDEKKDFSGENCRDLRSSVIKNEKSSNKIGERSIDSRILQTLINENLPNVALSYVKFLDKNNLFNPASVILAAEILYKLSRDKLVDESYVLHFHDEILQNKFANFLKISPMAQLFCLAPTCRWPEVFQIIDKSPFLKSNAHCYLMVAACLIEQNRFVEALEFLNNFQTLNLVVPDKSAYTANFHKSALNFILKSSSDSTTKFSNFVRYVDLLHDIRCSAIPSDLDRSIMEIFQNLDKNYKIDTGQIVQGRCTNCDQKMENEELTSEDFELMRRQVLRHLIKGDDVFRNSSPQEMQTFLRFVERNKPFELVFDSLNLAFAGLGRKMLPKDRPARLVNIVRNSIKIFRAKKACVVSRRHFFRDNEKDLAHINKLASVYLLDDKSLDDPFILYAALASGQNCYVISNDVYGFLNETLDPKTRSLFLRWRRTRLIGNFHVSLSGKPEIAIPPTFSVRCQRSGDRFHLPLIDRSDFSPPPSSSKFDNQDVASPSSWLCIRKNR